MDINDKVNIGILIDYYGVLLTENRKNMLIDRYHNDLSLAEIAENYNITRQGVRDNLLKGEKQLLDYEAKLNLMTKTNYLIDELELINSLVNDKGTAEKLQSVISRLKE